ncbi:hypothetical protein FNV43_RR07594 [Rhamnella rubrinervis]|uniref:Uncharacterized protein n=1 Tax=Rhamnella rubrinervis TaxID=2594499 RepID=A0A8K0HGW6_9ROSA|nr:hypothetical protein FNV43_RR07594 [Rhamnella rubrinervis]
MTTLVSQYVYNYSNLHFPPSNFLFHFPSLSRKSRDLLQVSRGNWSRGLRTLGFSPIRANCASELTSYGGWDDLRLVDVSDGPGESDQFRNFLVSVGIDDRKHIVVFLLGLVCALAISRVRISSIVVFPASVLVFAIGFSFGVVRGGGILSLSGNKRPAKEETFRVYIDKLSNLAEFFQVFDVKVSELKYNIQKAIDSREIKVADLENYIKVVESISLSASSAKNTIEASIQNVGSPNFLLNENQKSSKRKKEFGEIGYEFLQTFRGLFKENLVDSKGTKVNKNIKRETGAAVDDQIGDCNLIPSVEETVFNSVNVNKQKANAGLSHHSSNNFTLGENVDGNTKNGKMKWEEMSRKAYSNTDNKEYGYQNDSSWIMNKHHVSFKMHRDNQTERWESHDNLPDSVNFSVRMKHMETETSLVQEQKLKKSDGAYQSSFMREEGDYDGYGSPFREETVDGKDNSHVTDHLSRNESEEPSPLSSMVSDDVTFDRYLTEANDMLKQAKEFIKHRHETEHAEIILYRSAKLLSKAISMKPMSLLAVGQLGNTYLLHGELKLRISRELRIFLSGGDHSSFESWGRAYDQISSKDEIASVLINVCEECEELLMEAGRKYRLALSIDGNDVRALYNWGLALSFRGQLLADIGPEAAFEADKVFLAAIDKFDAMMSKGNVYAPDALFRWGMTLQQRSRLRPINSKEKAKLLHQAKRLYEDALHMDSKNLQVRQALSTCVSEISSRRF